MAWRELPELRCVCGRLLLKGVPLLSQLQVKCHRCHLLVNVGQEYDTFTAQQYAFLVEIDGEQSKKLKTRIVDCTSSVEKALGYTRDELLVLNDAIDPILAHGGYDDAWMLYSKTQLLPFSVDTIHRRKDGALIKVRARGNFQRQGKVLFLLFTFDILETEGVTYDPEFRIAGKELSVHMCKHILELSPKGECSYVSSQCLQALGGTSRDLSRSLIFDFVAVDEREAVRKRYLDCAHSRQSFRISVLTLVSGDGSHFVVEAHCTARYSADGVFEGYIVSLWPVDELALLC